ncbi:type VI secretion IcmF C-terminal domain-containing protein [Pseudomonas aeruginosa]|uniref:type VI secretion IcmF C-terminal domain-containing protein n=1 Tax=Pseudomonas aeruginosa TaxID=287 RepID=UPI0021555EC2|nr:type VI secretion IcmF C-terminal domain-containing protein [Pseudomonas aeruginosa]
MHFVHDLSRTVSMQWPSDNGLGVLRLTVTPPPSSGRSGLTLEGPWAWFRLLEQSDLERVNSPQRVTLQLHIHGSVIS